MLPRTASSASSLQAKESLKLYQSEIAKTVFAKTMIMIRTGDSDGASRQLDELMTAHLRAVLDDADIFKLCLAACRSLSVDKIAKNKAAMVLPATFPSRGTWSAARHRGQGYRRDGGSTTRLIG